MEEMLNYLLHVWKTRKNKSDPLAKYNINKIYLIRSRKQTSEKAG